MVTLILLVQCLVFIFIDKIYLKKFILLGGLAIGSSTLYFIGYLNFERMGHRLINPILYYCGKIFI